MCRPPSRHGTGTLPEYTRYSARGTKGGPAPRPGRMLPAGNRQEEGTPWTTPANRSATWSGRACIIARSATRPTTPGRITRMPPLFDSPNRWRRPASRCSPPPARSTAPTRMPKAGAMCGPRRSIRRRRRSTPTTSPGTRKAPIPGTARTTCRCRRPQPWRGRGASRASQPGSNGRADRVGSIRKTNNQDAPDALARLREDGADAAILCAI